MTASPYRGYEVLDESGHWDERTRQVVQARVEQVPQFRFFDADDAALLEAVCDRIMPQQDRPPTERVPIAPFIDELLHDDNTDGFRHADMPWEQDAWRLGLRGIDEVARERHSRSFVDLDDRERDDVLQHVQQGQPDTGAWSQVKPKSFFSKIVEKVVTVYYAHPTAWNEIGWAGPASPRGYARTGYGRRDPWEPAEHGEASSVGILQRYEQGKGTPSGTGGATH